MDSLTGAAPTAYGYALLPPVRNADPTIRDVHEAYRQEHADIAAELGKVAQRFGHSTGPVIWEVRAAAAVPFLQRPEGARLLDDLAANDLVIAARLGEILSAAADAAPLVDAFRQRQARLYVADAALELTARGDAEKRALTLLAALAESYDERRRHLWAEQHDARAAEPEAFQRSRQRQAVEEILARRETPASFAAADSGLYLDDVLAARLQALVEAAGEADDDAAALSRLLATQLGVRLTPKQAANLRTRLLKRRSERG